MPNREKSEEIVKGGVSCYWSAFDLARIGKDQMYAKAEENFKNEHGIEVEISDMEVSPLECLDEEVEWLCVPTDYKIKNVGGKE